MRLPQSHLNMEGNIMNTSRRIKSAFVAVAVVGTLGLAGCSNDSSTDTTVAAKESVPAGITVTNAWARTSAAGAMMGAAYLTLTSGADDALVGVSVDASVAGMAQIHEVVAADGSSMSSDSTMMGSDTTMAGEMKMQEVDRIDLPAGTKVELKPGGYHIMLMQLAGPLQSGATISLTLKFENAGEKTVDFPVMDDAPSGS